MTSLRALCILITICILTGCKSYKQQEEDKRDTARRGMIHVSADESFKPLVEELRKVYESNHPRTTIDVTYKPEADCLKDLLNDSVRMVIVTRAASPAESRFVSDSLKTGLESMVIARDGVALVVNNESPDTLLTMQDVKDILRGRFKKNLIPVFDGLKATSTVRYIIDSVLRGDSLTSKAMAARSSEAVLEYVASHPDAIGFIGVSWIGNKDDKTQLSFLKKVKVVNIESADKPDSYVKAYQANIYSLRYPMVRDLVYILRENYKGLGDGFANFMSGEIGQMIIRRQYLAPMRKNLNIRKVRY